jgi:hypothetical protein
MRLIESHTGPKTEEHLVEVNFVPEDEHGPALIAFCEEGREHPRYIFTLKEIEAAIEQFRGNGGAN